MLILFGEIKGNRSPLSIDDKNMKVDISKIIARKLTETANEEDLKRLENWSKVSEQNRTGLQMICEYFSLKVERSVDKEQTKSAYKHLEHRINNQPITDLIRRSSLVFWQMAAVILLLISVGGSVLFLMNWSDSQSQAQANLILTTEVGQRSQATLPDGSKVWLNANTKLVVASDFGESNRNVSLKGQAYFDVVRNENTPFIVECNHIDVAVLGTKFDVSSYSSNENVVVVLESGKVELQYKKNKSSKYVLNPGEQGEFNPITRELEIKEVDVDILTCWRNGMLIFRDHGMEEVLAQLEKRFNVEVIVEDPEVYNSLFTATIKDESLEQIINLMEYSCSVECNIIWRSTGLNKTKVIITK